MKGPGRDALFVEGPDDGVVVNALAGEVLELDLVKRRLVKVGRDEGEGGFDQALTAFRDAVSVIQPGGRIGLLVDRDGLEGKPDRWSAVRATLVSLGLSPPEVPSVDGWVSSGSTIGSLVGVWLMPDNLGLGDLEMFLEQLLPEDRTLWAFAASATAEARNHAAAYQPKDERKAVIHAWTAWLSPPGGGYGLAIKRGDLDSRSPAAVRFLAWFQRLFQEGA